MDVEQMCFGQLTPCQEHQSGWFRCAQRATSLRGLMLDLDGLVLGQRLLVHPSDGLMLLFSMYIQGWDRKIAGVSFWKFPGSLSSLIELPRRVGGDHFHFPWIAGARVMTNAAVR